MAGLGNTGINGFLSSAKLTGQKIIKRGKEIPEMVEHFLSGFAGYGWKIWEHRKGKYKLEIDDLNVRGTMTVYELLIQKIRAVIGALAITQGQGKIKSVALSPDQSEYLIQIEEDMSFREYDFIRCQTWTGNAKMYHVKIGRISDNTIIHIPIEEFDTDYDEFGQLVIHNAPAIGDDIIQFGNEVYEDRQSAIYLHVDESGQPAIDIMFGINSKDWTNCVKGRLGGDIPGGDGVKGMYFENGMIKGTDETGHTVYCIYPNGDAMFGDGSAMFNSDRSGQLAGGAIQWHFNDDKGRFELILGEDVIMSWDNLDNTTKEMLTPKIGENGNWWIGGKDTGQKAEGEDGTSPRIGENGNWWLGTTDTGVQAKANDGKSPYIGTNGNWFIWDATQNKFVDSGDTSVGDDGKSPEIRDGYWWTWDGTEYVNTGVKAKGEDANLLDWVNEWNNNRTLIGAEYIVSPKTFSGTRGTDGKLTGIAMGRDCIEIDGVKRTGIFALVDDEIVFELDPISKKYKFTGEIEATSGDIGGFIIEEDNLRSQNSSMLTLNGKDGSLTANNAFVKGIVANNFVNWAHAKYESDNTLDVLVNPNIYGNPDGSSLAEIYLPSNLKYSGFSVKIFNNGIIGRAHDFTISTKNDSIFILPDRQTSTVYTVSPGLFVEFTAVPYQRYGVDNLCWIPTEKTNGKESL